MSSIHFRSFQEENIFSLIKISDTCKNFLSHICGKHVNLVDNLAKHMKKHRFLDMEDFQRTFFLPRIHFRSLQEDFFPLMKISNLSKNWTSCGNFHKGKNIFFLE